MKRLLVTLATLIVVILSLPLVSFGLNLSGYGTATIDGVMSPGEWDNAAKVDFHANIPGGDTTTTPNATLYVMNDGNNLYIAVKIARSAFGYTDWFTAYFDKNDNGIAVDGDDVIAMYCGVDAPTTFLDLYRYTAAGDPPGSASSIAEDNNPAPIGGGILPAGTQDGFVGAKNDGSFTVIELSHPLCSTDTTHDFCLKPGNAVGLHAYVGLSSIPPAAYDLADTWLPTQDPGSYYQITIASPVTSIKPGVTQVVIDIKPGSRQNSINLKSEGKIPVAILSSPGFNAPVRVDRESLTFGHDGTEKSLAFCNTGSEDVNNDGLPDLVCHFTTQLTGFQQNDTVGTLKGKTKDLTDFTATDSVRIVPR